MHINPTVHCTPETRAFGEILTLSSGERFMTFRIAEERYGGSGVDLIIRDTALLDMISNEADRLAREFIGDAAPLEPLPAPPPLSELRRQGLGEPVLLPGLRGGAGR